MNQNQQSQNSKKILGIIGVFSILVLGLFIGSQIQFTGKTSLQGYLLNTIGHATDSNATNSNATNSNATNSNATHSNATHSNATNSNATNSNVEQDPSYNVLYLNQLSISSTEAKPGERVSIKLSTSGANATGGSIIFHAINGDTGFTSTINSIANNPYIVIPNATVPANYAVTDILLTGKNANGSTFTKQFSKNNPNATYHDFNQTIVIKPLDNNNSTIALESISLEKNTAKVNEKVYVTIKTNSNLTNAKLKFLDSSNHSFTAYVKSLDNKPYFEIPSNVTSGSYQLVSATLESNNKSTKYDKNGENGTEKYDFTTTLEIKNTEENSYIYNNEDINNEIISKLYNLKSGSEITINADSSAIIDLELFNAIKGRNKTLTINYKDNQIVFNGQDITDPKAIDVSVIVEDIKDNDDISDLIVNDGVVVSFADNGYLPGKALARIKATEEVEKLLNNEKLQVYYYNEDSSNFCRIANDIKKTKDGYYEFNITHTSDYVITTSKIKSSLIVENEDDDNVVTFQKSNKIYILLILIGLLVIIGVGIIIMIQKNKENKKKETKKKETSSSSEKKSSKKSEREKEDEDEEDEEEKENE